MGILNLTDDSFFDGGKYSNKEEIIARCKTMLDEGATMIDIGAQSSRPGATQISSKEELKKLIPIIKLLKNNFPNILISVDTFWSNTAKECALVGTDVINDISAGEMDKEMFPIIAELNIPYKNSINLFIDVKNTELIEFTITLLNLSNLNDISAN